ncbi:MAG: MFS transporter, partial [Promethearchaeota archaeon]
LFFIMIIIFLPIWYRAVIKWGLKRAFMISLILMGFGFISFLILGELYATAVIGLILIGGAFSGYYLMGQMVFADVVDYDETKTGKRREATYAGTEALVQKPAISIAPAIFLWVIVAFGFDETLAIQTANARFGILLAFSVIPGIILLLGGLAVKFYPLGGPEWIKQKEELNKIHEEKEKKYLQSLKEKGLI